MEDKRVVGARNGFKTTVKGLGWQNVTYIIACERSDVL